MMITMQIRNTIVAMGGMFLFLQVFPFIAYVRGSGGTADDVLQLDDNPCLPISIHGLMIPTTPEYMPSFPSSVKGITQHFACRPVFSKEVEATTISSIMDSTTAQPPTTRISSNTTEAEATTISAMVSTLIDPPTTNRPATQVTTTTKSTTDSTTSNTTSSQTTVKVFVTDESTTSKIFVADLQENLTFDYIPSTDSPRFITYDSVDEKIYWSDKGKKQVFRADIDGENRETVADVGREERRGIAIAETSRTLYIANTNPKTITSMSIEQGSALPGNEEDFVIFENDEVPISLEVDGKQKYLYWTTTNGKVQRKSLDGNGTSQDLYSDSKLSALYGLSTGLVDGVVFFCDYSRERTTVIAVQNDTVVSEIELTNHLNAPGYDKAGERLRDITFFNSVLYWTKETDPTSIAVMTNYWAGSRSYEIREISGIIRPYQLLITNIFNDESIVTQTLVP